METKEMPVVFTPGDEPYLGRAGLFHFDRLISSVLEQNAVLAPTSHGRQLSDAQQMACQVVPQTLSIMLSIRELIRQGYLFGAHVLVRALVERAAILLYIHLHPEEIVRWNQGCMETPPAWQRCWMLFKLRTRSNQRFAVRI